jgi:hypothetical protein
MAGKMGILMILRMPISLCVDYNVQFATKIVEAQKNEP